MDDIKFNLTDEQPHRADHVRNRERLLHTAKRLFTERGIDNVGMSEVAKTAEVGQATLYRHFKTKMDISLALLDEDQRDLQERALHQLRQSGDAAHNLRWFTAEVLQFVERNSQLLCVKNGGASSLQPAAHWWWRQTIRGLLGQINPPGDLDYLADALYILLDVHNVYFLRHARGFSLEEVTANLLNAIDRLTR
jgi:AcrR family transcriptional regulator